MSGVTAIFSGAHLLGVPEFARRFFRDFFLLLGPDSVVVLDNCHDVTDANFASILRIAAEQVPQDARLICTSRAVPSAELARLEINAQMLHLDWEELRLTLPEARQIVAAKGTSAIATQRNYSSVLMDGLRG